MGLFNAKLKPGRKKYYPYNRYSILIFVLPFVILYLVFRIWPILYAGALSLHEWQGLGPWNFVGFQNYTDFFSDPAGVLSAGNTIILAIGEMAIGIPLGFMFALLINNRRLPMKGVFRTIYFIPRVVALPVGAIIFMALFQRQYGVVNYVLAHVGIEAIPWLREPGWARLAVMITRSWIGIGFTMIYFTAGLQSIPVDFYEASDIDGANGLQQLIYITLPMLRRVSLFVLIITTVGAFQLFAVPYMMTGGGPRRATTPVMMYMLNRGISAGQYGYASAISILLSAFLAVIAALQFRFGGRER